MAHVTFRQKATPRSAHASKKNCLWCLDFLFQEVASNCIYCGFPEGTGISELSHFRVVMTWRYPRMRFGWAKDFTPNAVVRLFVSY